MFKSLKVFSNDDNSTIAIVGPKRRAGRLFEVVHWSGFDASDVSSLDERLEYAQLFADAPRLKAENERLKAELAALSVNGPCETCRFNDDENEFRPMCMCDACDKQPSVKNDPQSHADSSREEFMDVVDAVMDGPSVNSDQPEKSE